MYCFEFTIKGLTSTTNSGGRAHWALKAKEARKWHELVFMATLSKKPITPIKHAKLTLTRHSSKEPDFDGLVSSFKHVIDGLVVNKILENDKRENIGQPNYLWENTGQARGKITVRVEEIESHV